MGDTEKGSSGDGWIYVIVILIPCVISFVIVVYCIRSCMCVRKDYIRKKDYDAFLFYDQKSDRVFALDMLCELEEKCKLKLCDPMRNFRSGFQTNWNVTNAIESSNNALIIISSEEFFNSERCRNVFDKCKNKNKKDSLFKLVIIWAESDDLTNVSQERIKIMSKRQIHLEHDDPNLCQKLYTNLTILRSRKSKKAKKN